MVSIKKVGFSTVQTDQNRIIYEIQGQRYKAEEAAINHYSKIGYKSIWSENIWWWHILALLFWDVIFAKVRGAVMISDRGYQYFPTPEDPRFNQSYSTFISLNGMPADFFKDNFYTNRKELIQNRIKELRNRKIDELIESSYKANKNKTCRLIEDWNKYTVDQLTAPLRIIDRENLFKMLEWLLMDFNGRRAGIPDLVVFNDSEFFFAEVKSENDSISQKQLDWHLFLEKTGFKVELVLINHTEKKVQSILKKYESPSRSVVLSIGKTSSGKFDEAISHLKAQESYKTIGSEKDVRHEAEFSINENNLEGFMGLLDISGRWKSTRIEIDGKEVSASDLRNSLYCFTEKAQLKATAEYCKKLDRGNGNNKFGCRAIELREHNQDSWTDYGYVDTEQEIWVFNKDRIKEKVSEEMKKLRFCPLLDSGKILKSIEKIPETIAPRNDDKWAWLDSDNRAWYWVNNEWIGEYGETSYPGTSAMVGVKKVKKSEINRAAKEAKDLRQYENLSNGTKGKKSGCFIASAVYQSYDSPEVLILRKFRDTVLLRSISGRLLISIYYSLSPPIASLISRSRFLRSLSKTTLDLIVTRCNDSIR